MKVTTWNVNGIRAREAEVLEWIQREQPDVLCLQEVKASPHDVPAALRAPAGYHCFWHGHKGYSGVALHLKKERFGEPVEFHHPPFDSENRAVAARAGNWVVASLYVPNGGKDFPAKMRFLAALRDYVQESQARGVDLLLCGDMNVALEPRDVHPVLRKPQQVGQTEGERQLFAEILAAGLSDLGRRFEPDNERLFTWWAPWRNMRQRNIGWRLDYLLASPALAERAAGCGVDRQFGTSDHAPVTAQFR